MEKLGRYFLLFMEVSFLGWAAETVFFLLCYGRLFDRGFMTLPFCTIYGCSFFLVYFLVGPPESSGRWRYFLLCAAIPTVLELVTGLFFHRFFGLRLWNYNEYRFHLNGYICLEYALLWGLSIPVCMRRVFLPLRQRVLSLPRGSTGGPALLLGVLAAADWFASFRSLG